MESKNQDIRCNTFWDTETVVKKAERGVKGSKSSREREYYAQDILLEAEALVSCADYKAGNPDCVRCRAISCKYTDEYKHLSTNKKEENLPIKKRSFYV